MRPYSCVKDVFFSQVDSSKESAEAACDILSQLVNCSLKTLGLISTARPSFMDLPKVSAGFVLLAFTEKSSEILPISCTDNENVRKVVCKMENQLLFRMLSIKIFF